MPLVNFQPNPYDVVGLSLLGWIMKLYYLPSSVHSPVNDMESTFGV